MTSIERQAVKQAMKLFNTDDGWHHGMLLLSVLADQYKGRTKFLASVMDGYKPVELPAVDVRTLMGGETREVYCSNPDLLR